MPRLPLEICDAITDYLETHHQALKALAIASNIFRQRSQKHFLRFIRCVAGSKTGLGKLESLLQDIRLANLVFSLTIHTSSELRVRSIPLTIFYLTFISRSQLATLLTGLPRLQRLEL